MDNKSSGHHLRPKQRSIDERNLAMRPLPRLPIQLNGDNYEPMELDVVEQDESDELPVLDEVNLDLESYISHYQGLPRIYRLEFIADHCKSLRIEALTLALNYIKENTCNVKDYTRLFKKLQEAYDEPQTSSSQQPSGSNQLQPDTAWIDTKLKQAALKYAKLESELKNFRANSMKENIRRAQDDMGDHYLDCGDLENAFNAYTKSRDFAATHRSQINQCLNIIRVSILLRRWSAVSNHVLRAESQPNNDNQTHPTVPTKLHCAAGLHELNSKRYKKAAKHFLSTNFDHFDAHFGILAPINIAVYGSLCALATYTRQELANQLINSASFKQFAELDPQLREAVSRFYESKYASCLSILQEVKNILLLDMYLAPHVERLYRAIRNKALVQYFEPYSSASMHKMAQAFYTNVNDLEKEIINLIYEGHIKARIDSHNKILFAKNTHLRSQTFERAINMGKMWQRQTRALISRTAILNAGLEVTSNTPPDLPDRASFG